MLTKLYTIEVKHENPIDEEWEYIHFPYYDLSDAQAAVERAIRVWAGINPIIDYRFVVFVRETEL